MRLEHYRKLYFSDAKEMYLKLSKEELVNQLLGAFGIRDWKLIEQALKEREKKE